MRRAGETKSRFGTGILLQMYWQMTSMLYRSCAEIGTIGAPSAQVPEVGEKGGRGNAFEREGDRSKKILQELTFDKVHNLGVLLFGLRLLHQVNFVLENDDVLQLHNLNGCQVLRGLRLRARFVAG